MFELIAIIPHGNVCSEIEKSSKLLFEKSDCVIFHFYPKIIPLFIFEPLEDNLHKKALQTVKTILNKSKIELCNPCFVQKDDISFFCVDSRLCASVGCSIDNSDLVTTNTAGTSIGSKINFSALDAMTKPATSKIFIQNKMILGFSSDKNVQNEQPELSFESEKFDVYQIALFRFESTNADGSLSFKYEIIDSVWV